MSPSWDGRMLLEPITADRPCGESLEDTDLFSYFDSLPVFGQMRSPDAPPEPGENRKPLDWAEVQSRATEALARSKDLRLLAYLAAAALRTQGLDAFLDTLTIADRWLDSYWALVFPVIDDDALMRKNALNCLADPMAVVERVRRTPFVINRQYGNFSLRDLDLATSVVSPVAGEAIPSRELLDAALSEASFESLMHLQRSANESLAALKRLEDRMAIEGVDMIPAFGPLSAQLIRFTKLLQSSVVPSDSDHLNEEGVVGAVSALDSSTGSITSRQEALHALDAVAEFLRRTEPTSPVPLVIERAKRLMTSNFLDVLADLPLSAQEATGSTSTSSSDPAADAVRAENQNFEAHT